MSNEFALWTGVFIEGCVHSTALKAREIECDKMKPVSFYAVCDFGGPAQHFLHVVNRYLYFRKVAVVANPQLREA